MPSRVTFLVGAQRVSPVAVLLSLATAPISPAPMKAASSCFFPFGIRTLFILSVSPVRIFIRGMSGAIFPDTTLKYESFPTNGSATVLNTIAAAAPFTFTDNSTGSPFMSVAISFFSSAEGTSQFIPLSRCSIPKVFWASPQNTGVIVPSFTPLLTPTITSSGVNSSPLKYFSNISSSVSATASYIAVRSPSSLSPISGIAV